MLCNKATCSAAKFTVSFLLLHNKVYSQFSYAFCLLKFTPFCLVLQAYIHSRMRAKTSDFLKVLNRARPEVKDKEKKTIRSAIFRSFMYLYIFLWSLLLCFRKFFVKNLIFLGKFSSNFLFFFSGKTFRQQWKSWVFRSFEKSKYAGHWKTKEFHKCAKTLSQRVSFWRQTLKPLLFSD